ncbi:MAG: nucleotidyltransferase domain-containing protein [Patescibacteria group bacterium]
MIDQKLLSQKFTELAASNGLVLGVLFGSQATGRTHPRSDIDIGFITARRLGLMEIAVLQEKLMVATGYGNIELTDLKNVSPLLLKNIAEEGVLLYEKESGDFDRLKIYGLKLYMEAEPLFKMQTSSILSFIKRHA